MTRFDILKGKTPLLKKPVDNFSKPVPGSTAHIVIDGKPYSGHFTNFSVVSGIAGRPSLKRGTLIIGPNAENQLSAIQDMLNSCHYEVNFYVHGVDQPQKMHVQEVNWDNSQRDVNWNNAILELSGIILS